MPSGSRSSSSHGGAKPAPGVATLRPDDAMSVHTEEVQHVAELVDRAKISMLTTMTASGKHVSRPMAVQEVEFDGDLWFFCYDDSDKVQQIRTNPEVNVSFANDKQSEWTSLSGRAEIVYDRQHAERLWAAPLKVWFPDAWTPRACALSRSMLTPRSTGSRPPARCAS
jgi:general stress protein 26